jgi:hypothetical protein
MEPDRVPKVTLRRADLEAGMVWDVSFTCDICGKKKGEANHWWMVALGSVPCFDEGQPGLRFTLLPWNAAESRNNEMYHLCGQGCAMKAMERFMTTGEIEPAEIETEYPVSLR